MPAQEWAIATDARNKECLHGCDDRMGITMIVVSTHLEVLFRCFGFIERHIFEFPIVLDRIRGYFLARLNTWRDRFGELFDSTALCRRGTSEGLSFT
jgi:hypothetical protein